MLSGGGVEYEHEVKSGHIRHTDNCPWVLYILEDVRGMSPLCVQTKKRADSDMEKVSKHFFTRTLSISFYF